VLDFRAFSLVASWMPITDGSACVFEWVNASSFVVNQLRMVKERRLDPVDFYPLENIHPETVCLACYVELSDTGSQLHGPRIGEGREGKSPTRRRPKGCTAALIRYTQSVKIPAAEARDLRFHPSYRESTWVAAWGRTFVLRGRLQGRTLLAHRPRWPPLRSRRHRSRLDVSRAHP
jgi:hypothetical protein